MTFKSLSIVIPCYNEEKRILKTLCETLKYCRYNLTYYEIIIVDNNCTDNTINLIKNLKKIYKKNNIIIVKEFIRGKGSAIKTGILKAKHKKVMFMDADLATPLKHINDFLNVMYHEDVDGVIASRNMDQSSVTRKQGSIRQLLGKSFPFCVKLITDLRYSDTQCGFKMFNREKIIPVVKRMKEPGFAFDVELLYLAEQENVCIVERPVEWHDEVGSTVKFWDPLKMLLTLFRVRRNHKR